MVLKSLELIGFKSFGEATRLDFTQGFTAIVGPNGCGKSNVSDAIRWVIGEHNSRTLRGSNLTDLIFNGSQSRKPLNRAEIGLVIGDLPKGLRIANVPNTGEEIKITRCYHRSGESEYYINQVPCRLKDIVDLFLDLGISSKSMTIIEQNHIHEIITSKPEERRNLIEEAAGILKFKHRRHEAQLKLSSAEQNLIRIADIVKELGRQAESLKRQAAKADRYKRYQTEIKDLQINIWARKLQILKKELDNVEVQFSQVMEQKSLLSVKSSDLEIQIEQLKIKIEEIQVSLNQKRVRLHELISEIHKNENAVELRQSQIQTAKDDTLAAENEIVDMRNEIETLGQEMRIQRDELKQISEDIEKTETTQRQKSEALTTSKNRMLELQEVLRLNEEALKHLYYQIAQKENEITALETRKEFLKNREEKLLKERSGTVGDLDKSKKVALQLEIQLQESVEALEGIKAENMEVLGKINECKTALEKQNRFVDSANENFLARRSLLESMRDLRNKFEGFQDGVKSLMGNSNGDRFPGLREVLANVIQTPIQYELALEATLGSRLQSVIVNSHDDTVQAINYLKSHQSGRSSFIPIKPKSFHQVPINLNGDIGVIGKMIDKVQCADEYRQLLSHLIGDVVLVKDLEIALSLHTKPGFQGVVVTQNGEIIDSNGIVSGGQTSNTDNGLLSQKREIESLEREVEVLREKFEVSLRERDQLAQELNHFESRLSTIQPALREAEIAQVDRKRDFNEIEREIERFDQKLSNLDYEMSSGKLELQELYEESNRFKSELDSLEGEKKGQETKQSMLRQKLEELKNELEKQTEDSHNLEVLIASIKGKREILLSEIKRVNLQEGHLNQSIEKRQKDLRLNAGKIVEHQDGIESIEQLILNLVSEKNNISEEAVNFEECWTKNKDNLGAVEQESRAIFKDISDVGENISRAEVKRSEIKMQITHIQDLAYNNYELSLGELVTECDDDIDEIEVFENLKTLKEKVSRMGEVNLAALSEFQQTHGRHTFLYRQQEDLKESIKTLNQAIEKINKKIKERFLKTFHLVNEQFQSIYERLFQGGQASLIMLDEANPLESGIDINAQPLGKKMQNLSLLSGGEKAMTAISLIFSLLKVRPSPFCLLDEVDAPLDEPNVVRFQTILQEMADNTQFILITHNQKTMSFADILYGVTMEERGVSKAVSVQLN